MILHEIQRASNFVQTEFSVRGCRSRGSTELSPSMGCFGPAQSESSIVPVCSRFGRSIAFHGFAATL